MRVLIGKIINNLLLICNHSIMRKGFTLTPLLSFYAVIGSLRNNNKYPIRIDKVNAMKYRVFS